MKYEVKFTGQFKKIRRHTVRIIMREDSSDTISGEEAYEYGF